MASTLKLCLSDGSEIWVYLSNSTAVGYKGDLPQGRVGSLSKTSVTISRAHACKLVGRVSFLCNDWVESTE